LVEAHYVLLFEDGPSLAAEAGTLSFTGSDTDPGTLDTLARLGFREPGQAAETVRGWHFGRRPAVTSARAREALTELTPALLVAFGRSGDPDAALNTLDDAFARMPAAVELLSMLRSHEALLGLFATILGSAPRMARIVSSFPHVLDGVIDPAFATAEIDAAAIAARIRASVGDPAPSFEDALDRLRDASRIETFLVNARMLSGILAPRRAGLAASIVADAVIAVALDEALRDMARAHGPAPGARVAVLGMGRLGVSDLTATSDLDLLILYDAPDMEAASPGARPLDAVTWHQRLAQRLVTALTAPTRRGTLHEVDLRLRPAGRKGPIAVRLSSFQAYQSTEAETWEHMALTKARLVAGDAELGLRAMDSVGAIIARERPGARLRRDIREMRALIAQSKGDDDGWNLKLAKGGLTDIDFIAEALVLEHAHHHTELAETPADAVFAVAARLGLIADAERDVLEDAQRLMNDVTHWQRLTIDGAFEPDSVHAPVMRLIARAANAPDRSALEARLAEARASVRAIFLRRLG
jgi:glutamate-ammonia-ligase adenylyltransferase